MQEDIGRRRRKCGEYNSKFSSVRNCSMHLVNNKKKIKLISEDSRISPFPPAATPKANPAHSPLCVEKRTLLEIQHPGGSRPFIAQRTRSGYFRNSFEDNHDQNDTRYQTMANPLVSLPRCFLHYASFCNEASEYLICPSPKHNPPESYFAGLRTLLPERTFSAATVHQVLT